MVFLHPLREDHLRHGATLIRNLAARRQGMEHGAGTERQHWLGVRGGWFSGNLAEVWRYFPVIRWPRRHYELC